MDSATTRSTDIVTRCIRLQHKMTGKTFGENTLVWHLSRRKTRHCLGGEHDIDYNLETLNMFVGRIMNEIIASVQNRLADAQLNFVSGRKNILGG